MVRFAGRVEAALGRHDALPKRSSNDRPIIGDLADLESRLPRVKQALNALVARPKSLAGAQPFDHRLVRLASEVDGLHAVLRDLRGPMRRLVKKRCGNIGLAVAALMDASGMLK